jgi:hypothetical protein
MGTLLSLPYAQAKPYLYFSSDGKASDGYSGHGPFLPSKVHTILTEGVRGIPTLFQIQSLITLILTFDITC